jgi:hypothetical protein
VTGTGFGLALATAASAALVDLPTENAGIGSAVMQAVQKAGAPLSAAILGSVLASGYHSQLPVAGLSAATRGAVRTSVFAGIAVARKLGSPALLESVRSAFVHGIDAVGQCRAGDDRGRARAPVPAMAGHGGHRRSGRYQAGRGGWRIGA